MFITMDDLREDSYGADGGFGTVPLTDDDPYELTVVNGLNYYDEEDTNTADTDDIDQADQVWFTDTSRSIMAEKHHDAKESYEYERAALHIWRERPELDYV